MDNSEFSPTNAARKGANFANQHPTFGQRTPQTGAAGAVAGRVILIEGAEQM